MKKKNNKSTGRVFNDVSALKDLYYKNEYMPPTDYAFLIDRVSSSKQKDKSSPKVQQRGGNEYTKAQGLIVVEVFSLIETAYFHEERKLFNEIIFKVKKSFKSAKKIMHLVFSHASRASRNKLSTHDLRELVLKYRVVLHYFRDGLVLHKASSQETWDRWEKMHQNSEDDNIERRTNTIDGMLLGYEEGYAQQVAPYGYKAIMIEPELPGYAFEAPYISYVEKAFQLVLTGDPDFKSKLDQSFAGIIPKDELPNKERMLKILRDPFYCGKFDKQGMIFDADPKRQPALVSNEIWHRVQRILDNSGRNSESALHNFAYTGTIKCGGAILDENGRPTDEICGGSVSGEMKRGKSVTWSCGCSKKNCSQRNAKYMRSIGSQRYFSHEKIEEMLFELIKGVNLTEDILEWFRKKVEATILEESDFNKSKIAKIQGQITKKENVLKNLIRDRASRSISESEYRDTKLELEDELKELKEKLKLADEVKVKEDWIQDAIMKKISNLKDTFLTSPDHAKNKMVLSFYQNMVLRHGNLESELRDFMRECTEKSTKF